MIRAYLNLRRELDTLRAVNRDLEERLDELEAAR